MNEDTDFLRQRIAELEKQNAALDLKCTQLETKLTQLMPDYEGIHRIAAERIKQLEAELQAARAENAKSLERHRWNIEEDGDNLRICRGTHDKDVSCSYETYVPEAELQSANLNVRSLAEISILFEECSAPSADRHTVVQAVKDVLEESEIRRQYLRKICEVLSEYRAWPAQLDAIKELQSAKARAWCNVCAGSGNPGTGRFCICNGTGSASEAQAELTKTVLRQDQEIATLREALIAVSIELRFSTSPIAGKALEKAVAALKGYPTSSEPAIKKP